MEEKKNTYNPNYKTVPDTITPCEPTAYNVFNPNYQTVPQQVGENKYDICDINNKVIDANENSSIALDNSLEALSNVGVALEKANEANGKADGAITASNDAKSQAEDALIVANGANDYAITADSNASEAKRIAQEALDKVVEGTGTTIIDYNGNKLKEAKFKGSTSINVDMSETDPHEFEFRVDKAILDDIASKASNANLIAVNEKTTANSDAIDTINATLPNKANVNYVDDALSQKANTQYVNTELGNKVSKEQGKGLSSNDFTNADVTSVAFAESERLKSANLFKIIKIESWNVNTSKNVRVFINCKLPMNFKFFKDNANVVAFEWGIAKPSKGWEGVIAKQVGKNIKLNSSKPCTQIFMDFNFKDNTQKEEWYLSEIKSMQCCLSENELFSFEEYNGAIVHSTFNNVTYPTNTQGQTTQGTSDRVIETYVSSDFSVVYRKWASGWKEVLFQNVLVKSNSQTELVLPINFGYYTVNACSTNDYSVCSIGKLTNKIIVKSGISNSGYYGGRFDISVKGY